MPYDGSRHEGAIHKSPEGKFTRAQEKGNTLYDLSLKTDPQVRTWLAGDARKIESLVRAVREIYQFGDLPEHDQITLGNELVQRFKKIIPDTLDESNVRGRAAFILSLSRILENDVEGTLH